MEHALAVIAKSIANMVDGFFALLPNLFIGMIVLIVFTQLSSLSRRLVIALGQRARLDQTLGQALGSMASFATGLLGMLVVAVIVIPSFSPAHLIAGLGITSVAIGFAFKDILQNFFAGILLLWQKPFRIGDQIKTQTFEGTVEQIDIRSTRIITHSGELVVLPNDNIWTNPIVVNTALAKRRMHATVMVPDAVPFNQARTLLVETLSRIESVLKDPEPQVYVASLDGAETKFEIYFWTKPQEENVLRTTDEVLSQVKEGIFKLAASQTRDKKSGLETAAEFAPSVTGSVKSQIS